MNLKLMMRTSERQVVLPKPERLATYGGKSTPCPSYLNVVASEEQVTKINRGMKNNAMERETVHLFCKLPKELEVEEK
jgi:hypothetical protein